MARMGFGICLKNEETIYISPIYERECVKFEQLEADKVAERKKYIEGLNGRKP